jgi:hypothetical protein
MGRCTRTGRTRTTTCARPGAAHRRRRDPSRRRPLAASSYPDIAFFLAGTAVLALAGAALVWLLRGPTEDSHWPDVPSRIGGYEIHGAESVADRGVLSYEATGAFIGDAGFARLPGGPTPAVVAGMDTPRFRHLGGPWSAFTAGW